MELENMPVEGRAERKKKETRRKIVAVAIGLIERQGFNNTTMEQIANDADIARKTLYNHFPVKEAIVEEYVREISRGLAQGTFDTLDKLPDIRSRLLAALDKAYEWVEINPELTGICLGYRLKNMSKGSGYSDGETGTQSIMAEIIRKGQLAGEIRRDVSVTLLVAQIDIMRGVVVMDWLKDPSRFELRPQMANIVDLFLYGAIDREGAQ
ncbi:DNA-binding transcriptional regulator EnvR [Pelotomaculum sp. FP]|uniref:TetR/AcrR family transcriptional regulator n=1 Tax=Pelotomaculum sp. FP TaxID=261474 RepID=UPI001064A57B|nr:TetR/AcrR family transcriptional regulator [Pelotomaculum sp. FP]TEB13054.1 DNA-binding transcriptional regulator EnvR [Pelotomaculum sp. FP]